MTLTAFAGHPLALRPFVAFGTAVAARVGRRRCRIDIEKGVLRPGHGGAPHYVEFSGRIDGEIQDGEMQFEQNTCVVSKGRLKGGAYQAKTGEDGKLATALRPTASSSRSRRASSWCRAAWGSRSTRARRSRSIRSR